MNLHNMNSFEGSRSRPKRWDKNSGGRGDKGQRSRSGTGHAPRNHSGVPQYRKSPMRGFNNDGFREIRYAIVNVGDFENLTDLPEVIGLAEMEKLGLIRNQEEKVKILAGGDFTKKLTIEAHAFSGVAAERIEKNGGSCRQIKDESKPSFDRGDRPARGNFRGGDRGGDRGGRPFNRGDRPERSDRPQSIEQPSMEVQADS